MFFMYDSVDINTIPANPHAVLGYVNGQYANTDELAKRFPHARLLKMSVTGYIAAEGYDLERGDYPPDQAGELHGKAKDGGIWRPCFYAALSNMTAVKTSLAAAGVDRSDVRLLVASWDDVPLVPPGYDGKQFTSRALGRNLDESVLLDTFFQPAKPTDVTWDEVKVSFNRNTGEWKTAPLPGA